MRLTAQKLVLDLVLATPRHEVTARGAVQVGKLFEISENSVRVALARLVERGRLGRVGRGRYALTAVAGPVQRHVSSWARLEDRVTAWGGGWCGVHLSRPGQVGRQDARRRLRALRFLGLRDLLRGLFVRPDNLVGGVYELRRRLLALGLDRGSLVFELGGLDESSEERARALWDTRALTRAYRDQLERLERSAAKLEELAAVSLERALVESFLLGGEAINLLAFDPLLPEEILPAGDRRALVEVMRRYDRMGRRCWRTYAMKHSIPEIVLPLEPGFDGGTEAAMDQGG